MAKACKESFDAVVDRTDGGEIAALRDEVNDLNDELAEAHVRSIRQHITIIELARILGVEYGRK